MKLIMRDLSESSIELEEPEITIIDKKHPERSYILSPKGGYLMIDVDHLRDVCRIDMNTTIETIKISINTDDLKKYLYP